MSQIRAEETPSETGALIPGGEIPAEFPLWLRCLCGFLTFVNDLARRKDGTFNRRVMNLVERKTPPNPIPENGVSTKDVVIDHEKGIWARIFLPEDESSIPAEKLLPIVFYFHGGGFTTLTPDFLLYDVFCRRISRRRKVIVVSVNYRRTPEHRYPTAYEDCYVAVKWVGTPEGRCHVGPIADVSRCYLMGDSAGGNIVHHVGCMLAADVDTGPIKIVGHVLIQPFFGGEERTASEDRLNLKAPIVSVENSDWHWRAFLPEGENRDHPAANVWGPRGPDISGLKLPPSLVVVGGHDLLQDWQIRYVEEMRRKMKKDVELLFYGEAIHGFHIFFQIRVSSKLISDLEGFFKRCGD